MKKLAALALSALLFPGHSGRAVILLDTGDPAVNTSAPGGALSDSGWQYQGAWGTFLGTPIAPNYFISAAHIGQAANQFVFQGTGYTLNRSFSLPGSDLLIWRVNGNFPSFAPLYTKADEISKHLVVIGRGTQRGDPITLDGTLRGWGWGAGDGVWRWGENDVAEIVPYTGHDLLYATFDRHVQSGDHPNESHLSSGDSGGAVFLNDSGTWKLAGINYAVDDLYRAPSDSAQFDAAIFDVHGFYTSDGKNPPTFTQIPDTTPPTSTGFYASRISSELPWICSVIADPVVEREGNFLTLTYWRLVAPASDVVYAVERSFDLISWEPATTHDETVSIAGDLARVKSSVAIGTSSRLFIRLHVVRPP